MALEDVDVERQLHGIVRLGFSVSIFAATFLAGAGFDVAWHIAAGLLAQEILQSKQVVGTDAPTVDQRLTASHSIQGGRFSLGGVEAREINEWKLQLGNGLTLIERASLP